VRHTVKTVNSMNTARILKETEKTLFLHFGVDVWNELYYIKVWVPKSQLKIVKNENGLITYEVKNDWILFAKLKDYLNYLQNNDYTLSETKTTFLKFGTKEDVNRTYYTGLK